MDDQLPVMKKAAVFICALLQGAVVYAATAGSPSFSFLRNQVKPYSGIGAYGVATNAFVTGQTFGPGVGDGIYAPTGGSYDSANDLLYVAESAGGRIMKIKASTGVFMGAIGQLVDSSGTCPKSGVAAGWCTGGVFSSGSADGAFNGPMDVTYDSTHDALYVTDLNNHRVVKVTASTGAFAGAVGKTSATTGTCPASGVATGWCTGGTFVLGVTTDGGYGYPYGLTYDNTHNAIYLTDNYNNNVIKITATTGAFVGAIGQVVTSSGTCNTGTAAGWCTGGWFAVDNGLYGGYWYPTYIAYDDVHDALFVSSGAGSNIAKVTASTGAYIGSVGGSIFFSSGTCPGSGRAMGWCTGGYFQGGTGDGTFTFGGITGMAYDGTNDAIYVYNAGRIMKFTATTGAFVGSIGRLSGSTGTCPSSGIATTWCTGGSFVTAPDGDGTYVESGLIYDATHDALFALGTTTGRIAKITASTGAFVGSDGGLATAEPTWTSSYTSLSGSRDGMFLRPHGIAFDSANDFLFIADQYNSRVVKVRASTGAFIGAIGKLAASTGTCPASGAAPGWCTGGTFAIGTGDGMFYYPTALAYDSVNDALYVSDGNSGRIEKFTASTGAFVGAIGLTYTASTGTCPSSAVAPGWCTGGTFTTSGNDGNYYYASGIIFDAANDLLYISNGYYKISKVRASTGAFLGAIGKTTASSGTCPASGVATTWCTGGTFGVGGGDGMFSTIGGLAFDPVHDLLYASDNSNRIVKITASTGAFVGAVGKTTASTGTCPASGVATTWCTGGTFATGAGDGMFMSPDALVLNPANNALYVSDTGNHRVVKLSASAGSFAGAIGGVSSSSASCPPASIARNWCSGGTFSGASADGAFRSPMGLVYDATKERLYIVDSGNHRIVKTSK